MTSSGPCYRCGKAAPHYDAVLLRWSCLVGRCDRRVERLALATGRASSITGALGALMFHSPPPVVLSTQKDAEVRKAFGIESAKTTAEPPRKPIKLNRAMRRKIAAMKRSGL